MNDYKPYNYFKISIVPFMIFLHSVQKKIFSKNPVLFYNFLVDFGFSLKNYNSFTFILNYFCLAFCGLTQLMTLIFFLISFEFKKRCFAKYNAVKSLV